MEIGKAETGGCISNSTASYSRTHVQYLISK